MVEYCKVCNDKVTQRDAARHAKMHKEERLIKAFHELENENRANAEGSSKYQTQLQVEGGEDYPLDLDFPIDDCYDDIDNNEVMAIDAYFECVNLDAPPMSNNSSSSPAELPSVVLATDTHWIHDSFVAEKERMSVFEKLKSLKDRKLDETPLRIIFPQGQEQKNSGNITEEASLKLKAELKERRVSKNTTEYIYSFINQYMKDTGNGNY